MDEILVGVSKKGEKKALNLKMANRHGLIAGATGTGKTVTLQRIAEQLAHKGVSVFTADIKGDVSGIARPAVLNEKIEKRLQTLKIKDFSPQGCSVTFWDLYGEKGLPLRTTVSEIGPLLFGRLLNANDIQQGIINAAFSYADDEGLLLLDLKDLRSLLEWMSENAASLKKKYGNISSNSIGALQRGLLSLVEARGEKFFGEPALKLTDLLQKDSNGKGVVHILDATRLINDSRLYSTFLLWLLSELFEQLPEVGDLDKPKLVFFFDEAHLLFNSAPKVLLEKIEQVVRLVRSKGVGVFFITQTPLDIPETVLGQLGNRVQHALRAFTPKDQKSVKTAAETFRQNPKLKTEKIITELGVGEALVSFLDEKGSPSIVAEVKILPPESQIGAITMEERTEIINNSPWRKFYETSIDRESAYEIISKRVQEKQEGKQTDEQVPVPPRPKGRPKQSATEIFIKSTVRSVGSQLGRQVLRGVLGTIFGGKK